MRDLFGNAIAPDRHAALGKDDLMLVGNFSIDVGLDRPGADGVTSDAIPAKVCGHRPGQSDDAMFGRHIRTVAWSRAETLG